MNEFDKPSPGAAKRVRQYEIFRKETAAFLRLPLDHPKVEQIAFLKLLRADLVERFISGASIDIRALLEITKTLDEVSPTKPAPHIEITFSDEGGPPDRAPVSDTPSAIDTVASTDTGQVPDTSVDSVPTDADLADAAFKTTFGKSAHRGVAPSPPPPVSYMDSLKAEAKRTGYFPAVRFDDHGNPAPPKPVRHIGGFVPSDLGQQGREPNPFSVINDPVPGSRPEHLDKR